MAIELHLLMGIVLLSDHASRYIPITEAMPMDKHTAGHQGMQASQASLHTHLQGALPCAPAAYTWVA